MLLRELYEQDGKTAVLAFGRLNPPTIGHAKLVDTITSIAGDHFLFLSHTQKPKTDPLDFATKKKFAEQFFPGITIGHEAVKTPIQALEQLQAAGYTDVIFVAGSDRVEGFQKLFDTYNGQPDKTGKIPFKFNSIRVVSAGDRDPDADDVSGMSASKMRVAAASGELNSFAQGVPDKRLAKTMYNAVRAGMGVKYKEPVEEWIGPALKGSKYAFYIAKFFWNNKWAITFLAATWKTIDWIGDAIAFVKKYTDNPIVQGLLRYGLPAVAIAVALYGGKKLYDRLLKVQDEKELENVLKEFDSDKKEIEKLEAELDNMITDKKEDASPEEEDEFHRELDKLVHKTFGHSSDEKKMKKKKINTEDIDQLSEFDVNDTSNDDTFILTAQTVEENLADGKIKYNAPNFEYEWEEAVRYPEFNKLGKQAWIELASKGRAVTIRSTKDINNTDAADPDSFKLLDKNKQKRVLDQLKKNNVEMPIIALYSDGYKELVGGNTRLTALMSQQGKATVWQFEVPDEVAELAENFSENKKEGNIISPPGNTVGLNVFKIPSEQREKLNGTTVYHQTKKLDKILQSGGLRPRADVSGEREFALNDIRAGKDWRTPKGIFVSKSSGNWFGDEISFKIEPSDKIYYVYRPGGYLLIVNPISADRFLSADPIGENFADGKNPGRKGLAKRSGVNTKASVSSLRKTAKNSSGEKQRMAHWMANMKAGKAKKE